MMNVKSSALSRLTIFMLLFVFCFSQSIPIIGALSEAQLKLRNKNINYFDLTCSPTPNELPKKAGSGSETGAAFPNLPPEAMAKGINKYIEQTNPDSRMIGLGSTIVSAAEKSNVSPFLIVAIAQKESSLASPSDYNVINGHNAFGRTATAKQPNFSGSRLWYKWSSVRISLDYTARENNKPNSGGDFARYLRTQFGEKIDSGSLSDIMNEYAPPDENNTATYVNDIRTWTENMVDLTKSQGGNPTTLSPDNDLLFEDGPPENLCGVCPADGAGGLSGATLSPNVPEPWRSLIEDASKKPESASSDPNLVAAVLWVENRGWPDYNKKWAVSSAAAAGPFQFIPSTWASMGRDGDGDGQKDANNPKDAVLAAFIHHKGSKGKPVAKNGYEASKSAEENFNTAVLNRDDSNLLAFAAKYNGSGAPDGVKLKDFLRNENSDYVKMAYWLLASDFVSAYDVETGKTKDPKAGSGAKGKASAGDTGGTNCDTVSNGGDGSTIGDYAIPVPKNFWESNPDWFTKPHHDYPAADIPVKSGTNLYSVTSGTVISSGMLGSAGYATIIKYKNAVIGYYHGTPGSSRVKAGDSVRPGQLLMKSGYTGHVIPKGPGGAHLHLDIEINDEKRCPQALFKAMKAEQSINFDELPNSGCTN